MDVETVRYERGRGWSGPLPGSDDRNALVFVFAAPAFGDEPEPIEDIRKALPRSCIVGCSTSGEIHEDALHDDSVVAAAVRFDRTELRLARAPVPGVDSSRSAGESLARQLDDDALRAVFVLSDGLCVNGSALVSGINDVLDPAVVVTGGLAGDGDRFEHTWVLVDDKPASGWATAVGFYGDAIRVGHGSRGGWDIFGPERTVTSSQGNVLAELDGQPALDLYKRYLGDRAEELPGAALLFPLALRADQDDENRFVRTILAVDEDSRTMTFAGDVPVGYRAQLMRANFDRMVEGAAEAASVGSVASEGPVLSVAISCVGRRLVLGERTEDEIDATCEVLPPGSHQVGFYSYGELSPLTDGTCDLHNQTMTITTLSET